MSKPRYDWWGYVKGMIRRYPELCRKEAALHETSMSPNLSGMPHGSGGASHPVEDAALRELSAVNRREMAAVRAAIEATQQLTYGNERLQMVKLVFWDKTHTLAGAALALHVSERTVRRWHTEFINIVANIYGLH